jgi:hypothetical protein
MAAVAVTTSLLALVTTTRNYSTTPTEATAKVNQVLFEKFADPLTAASLKILRYDTDKEQYDEFEVAKDRKSGVWTIPSHENYPADANKQMSDAANLFVGLKALNVASTKRDEQKLFGVVEPDKKKESEGGDGVGELIQFRDEKGDMLADLIIGKADAQDPKKRFVRIPSEDVIYVAQLETNALSTDFKQWIESDLLKLSSNDIETIGIRNYALVSSGQRFLTVNPNYYADVMFNVRENKWQPKSLTVFEERLAKPRELDASEELNSTKLNDMKGALDNLRIVNVARKPAGVAADLKADNQLQEATVEALKRRGFFASKSPNSDDVELYAMNGDLQVTLKDGVQYLLRFGDGAGASFEPVESEPGKEGDQKEVSINRFLLVSARLDDSKFPPPELERAPESVEELKAIEAARKAALNPAPAAPNLQPAGLPSAEQPQPATPAEDMPAQEPVATAENTPAEAPPADPKTEPASDKPADGDVPKADDGVPKEGDGVPKQPVARSQRSGSRLVSTQDPAIQPAAPTAPAVQPPAELSDEEWKERLEAEKERINKENQRRIDQRNDRLEVAKKRVAELNARFADWYYIVSDSEFKRLKIEINDLITKKTVGLPNQPQSGLPGGLPGLNIPGLSDQ